MTMINYAELFKSHKSQSHQRLFFSKIYGLPKKIKKKKNVPLNSTPNRSNIDRNIFLLQTSPPLFFFCRYSGDVKSSTLTKTDLEVTHKVYSFCGDGEEEVILAYHLDKSPMPISTSLHLLTNRSKPI
ncbi:hypothetical protein BpHYR1_003102 [Brachionus plicatilis]|uniref:Uncharacterized protein n=1 Tax=Brachionus plicatilis TaxID=10195 RepID=A0A3M7SJD9_BRAPC|nr:hypothetical protein BpHYR1_003102 [Brachionus plicatilis]